MTNDECPKVPKILLGTFKAAEKPTTGPLGDDAVVGLLLLP